MDNVEFKSRQYVKSKDTKLCYMILKCTKGLHFSATALELKRRKQVLIPLLLIEELSEEEIEVVKVLYEN